MVVWSQETRAEGLTPSSAAGATPCKRRGPCRRLPRGGREPGRSRAVWSLKETPPPPLGTGTRRAVTTLSLHHPSLILFSKRCQLACDGRGRAQSLELDESGYES